MVQIPSKYRRASPLILLVCAAALFAGMTAAAPAATPGGGAHGSTATSAMALQDLDQLTALARSEATLHLSALTQKQRLLVGPIPPLRLAQCANGVKPSVSAAPHMTDRVLVELRCEGVSAWRIYVPVRIVGTTSVAVAAHAIVAGTVLTATDLVVEERDLTGLPPGYLDDPAIAVGLTAGRGISGGAVLTNQQLLAAKAVQRGQTVTLVANGGGMSVRMAGRALSDGLINQRIRVENLSSGKIVEGTARSEQIVEIIF
jgi:flagellar basal body P-ring formation protein FlgA